MAATGAVLSTDTARLCPVLDNVVAVACSRDGGREAGREGGREVGRELLDTVALVARACDAVPGPEDVAGRRADGPEEPDDVGLLLTDTFRVRVVEGGYLLVSFFTGSELNVPDGVLC